MKPVEFPPGSGRVAAYAPAEERVMRALVVASKNTGEPVARQVEVLHDLKIEFGVELDLTVELGPLESGDIEVRP